jgi:hypothetical protein
MLLKKLLAPYPPIGNKKQRYYLSIIAGLFVGSFLWLFRPFEIADLPKDEQATQAAAYGLVTFLTVFFNVGVLPDIIPSFFKSRSWSVLHEILFEVYNLLCITVGNTFMHAYLMHEPFKFEVLQAFFLPTFSIGFFPVVFYVLYRQIVLEKENVAISNAIQPLVSLHIEHERNEANQVLHSTKNALITLSSDDGKEEYSLPVPNIIYLEAAANYVELVYWSEGSDKPKKMLFRNTMKNIEAMLSNYPQVFLRCHRSFVVNIEQIKTVKGNSQGVNLFLGDGIDYVPVSRTNIPKLKQLLDTDSLVAGK